MLTPFSHGPFVNWNKFQVTAVALSDLDKKKKNKFVHVKMTGRDVAVRNIIGRLSFKQTVVFRLWYCFSSSEHLSSHTTEEDVKSTNDPRTISSLEKFRLFVPPANNSPK